MIYFMRHTCGLSDNRIFEPDNEHVCEQCYIENLLLETQVEVPQEE